MGGMTPQTVPEEVLLARAYLSRVSESACVPLWGEVRDHGPVAVAEAIRAGEVSDEIRTLTAARADTTDPHADLDAAQRCGARLLVPESDDWPHAGLACLERAGLQRLERWRHGGETKPLERGELVPPLALWVRGDLSLRALSFRSVAVVGSRNCTPYGSRVAKDLAFRLASRDFDVISGGAFGIDAAAHHGALAADGTTVIVSARGVDAPYPTAHARLFDRVAELGAIVSESPPGAAPHRHRFLSRNRLIAALGTGTVVVEAAYRSGALNTAGHCVRLDRTLMAVPGPVTSAMSAGAHSLLKAETRAELVCDAADVLELIGGPGDLSAPAPPTDTRLVDRVDGLTRRVFDGVPATGAISIGDLVVASGVCRNDVLGSLPALQRLGLVSVDGAGFCRLAARPGGALRPAVGT